MNFASSVVKLLRRKLYFALVTLHSVGIRVLSYDMYEIFLQSVSLAFWAVKPFDINFESRIQPVRNAENGGDSVQR